MDAVYNPRMSVKTKNCDFSWIFFTILCLINVVILSFLVLAFFKIQLLEEKVNRLQDISNNYETIRDQNLSITSNEATSENEDNSRKVYEANIKNLEEFIGRDINMKDGTVVKSPTRILRSIPDDDEGQSSEDPLTTTETPFRIWHQTYNSDGSVNKHYKKGSKRPKKTDHINGTLNANDRRRHRLRIMTDTEERSPKRPIAAHLNGDTSKYVLGVHTNYLGNGHLCSTGKTYVDWEPSKWTQDFGMQTNYNLLNGAMTIKQPGLYFIYAQIFYLDAHDTNGYRIYKNGDETILQCTRTTHSNSRMLKANTCYTAGVEYLAEGDQIKIADLSESRYSLFEPGKSFFGFVQISDAKPK